MLSSGFFYSSLMKCKSWRITEVILHVLDLSFLIWLQVSQILSTTSSTILCLPTSLTPPIS